MKLRSQGLGFQALTMAEDVQQEEEKNLDKINLDDSLRSPTILPWDRLSNWLHCVCVVTFDLELGQAMEVKT